MQIVWILVFYFLFNCYGKSILIFLSSLIPLSTDHEEYLYRECTGTVSVVFYGTLFNMVAQGIAFGLLMVFIGNYNAGYLGALVGFCSVIPLVGSALVYVPVIGLELLAGHYINALVILAFAWVVIGFLKKLFGFEYPNETLLFIAKMIVKISPIYCDSVKYFRRERCLFETRQSTICSILGSAG